MADWLDIKVCLYCPPDHPVRASEKLRRQGKRQCTIHPDGRDGPWHYLGRPICQKLHCCLKCLEGNAPAVWMFFPDPESIRRADAVLIQNRPGI